MEVNLDEYRAQVFGTQSPTHTPIPESAAPVTETVAETNTDTATVDPALPEVTVDPVVTDPVIAAPDYKSYLKENFNYEDAEQLKADLKAFKEKAETPAEIAFANEESKKIHQLLREGKSKEVKAYLDAQDLLSNLDGMNSEQQLKLYIKMQNPLFDQELIEDEYKSLYSIDETDLEDDPLKLRKEKVRLQQRLSNDVEKAKEYFTQYKTKIELPDISPKAEAAKDEAYENWKAQIAQQDSVATKTAEAYLKLSPKQAVSTFKFNDEASKLSFDTTFEPDTDSFANTTSLLADGEKLFAKYANQDGSLDHLRMAKDLYNGQNIDKIATEIMKQSVNSTKAWFLKNQKNIGDGVQRDFVVPPTTDIQKLKQQVFGN